MKGKSPSSQQTNFLLPGLREQLNPKVGLYRLAETINWDYFESEFSGLYSEQGRPAKPIRLMTGLLILKYLDNLSDEELVQRWVCNPYYQFFCGETEFQWSLPVDSSDLTYFRKRLGKDGVKKIFAQSVGIHGEATLEEEVLIDSTVQEKNITYPVDSKQHVKIINTCAKIAKKEGIKQRRSYLRNLGKLRYALRGGNTKDASKRKRKAARTLKTIAGRVVRELERKLSPEGLEKHKDKLDVFKRFLSQERHSKNKIYSLHEPEVVCYSKGKAHKKYEFGSKASIVTTVTSCIIVGVENFSEAIHDSKTIASTMEVVSEVTGKIPKRAFADLGYRGATNVGGTEIVHPKSSKKDLSEQEIKKRKNKIKRRSAIEPVISHLKSDHRLQRNFLKGVVGDASNLLMAACGFNFRKWIRKVLFWLLQTHKFTLLCHFCCNRELKT